MATAVDSSTQRWKGESKVLCEAKADCCTWQTTWTVRKYVGTVKVATDWWSWKTIKLPVWFSAFCLTHCAFFLQIVHLTGRTWAHKVNVCHRKKKWVNQAKQVQWHNWFGVTPPRTLQLGTKHNVPLSWKFGRAAFTSPNINKTHMPMQTIVDSRAHTLIQAREHRAITNSLLSALSNLLWFFFSCR